MKWLIALTALLVLQSIARAGLPPTTSYGVGDTSNKVTFNYQFPNFQITHTAVTANIDLPNVLGSYGTCTSCNLSYDVKGRIVAAANGSGSGSGSGTLNAYFYLENATIPYTAFGQHVQSSTATLTTVNIGMLNSGLSGYTTVRLNQYRSGSLLSSVTATASASSGNPIASVAAPLSGTLNLLSGDLVTADVVSSSDGSPEGLSVEY